jgi:hypothetical protein
MRRMLDHDSRFGQGPDDEQWGATTASLTPFVAKHFGWGAVFSGSRKVRDSGAPLPG